ncbi:NUMOD4 domain-containing protein [Chryseobacterium paludis]|uniref:NUMOD4 domain-containing protein n=1 Tax=Chryseobacterium paludis TaxID=2956784 RepID=UPI0021C20198|nr:NUMOD4 domain-containing protein [Chryseobacterium paludis]
MNLPLEIEDWYIKEVIYNTSLENLPGEEWKSIENFENYAVSSYGRVKSLEHWITSLNGRKWKASERMMKLQFMKFFNKYPDDQFYNVICVLSSKGKKTRKSVPRLVYYYFVEKFDLNDSHFIISFKDDNRFNLNAKNLEKLSFNKTRFKESHKDSAKNSKTYYKRPVNQYTTEGDLVTTFENIDAASNTLGIGRRNIQAVLNKERLTAGGFRWFFKDYSPKKEDFIISKENKSVTSKVFNKPLWEKLGKPPIDENDPPACMNLSLDNLPGEHWKPIPGLENGYVISNKGRVKRLSGWTTSKNKSFWKEQIMSLNIRIKAGRNKPYFYIRVNHKEHMTMLMISRLLYYCFVEEFDMNDKNLIMVNQSEPLWNLDITKLRLRPRISGSKEKENI